MDNKHTDETLTAKEFFKEVRDMQKETDKKIKELSDTVNKTTINVNNMCKEVGGMARTNGQIAEELIYNSLLKDMTFNNLKFYDIDKNWRRYNKELNIRAEFDIVLENGDTLAIIETKNKVRSDDVSELVNNVTNKFRKLYPKYTDYKILLGIGGMCFEAETKVMEEAKKNGVGIIKVSPDKIEYFTEGIKSY
jgi:hypothetical protein